MKKFFLIVGLLWTATCLRPLLAGVPTPETGTQIVARSYQLSFDAMKQVAMAVGRETIEVAKDPSIVKPLSSDEWKKFFQLYGNISWPEGSSIVSSPIFERLIVIVHNTATNLSAIEEILNTVPLSGVEVEVDFVAFDKKEIEALSRHKPLTCSVMSELYKSGKGELLAAPIIHTKSGMNAETKAVLELIYPTQFEYAEPAAVSTNGSQPGTTTRTVVKPSGFEKRDVGVILNVTPVLEPDGQSATLTLLPAMVFPPTWKDYGKSSSITNSLKTSVPMEQPFFTSVNATSSLKMRFNSTALLSGGLTMPDGKTMMFLFVRLRRVDMDGNVQNPPDRSAERKE